MQTMISHGTAGSSIHHHHRMNYNHQSLHRRSSQRTSISTIIKSCQSLRPASYTKAVNNIVSYIVIPFVFFYLGTRYQAIYVSNNSSNPVLKQQLYQQNCDKIQCAPYLDKACELLTSSKKAEELSNKQRPPKELEKLIKAMAHTSKQDFVNSFDLGVPIDSNNNNLSVGTNDNVLLLYHSTNTIPNRILQKYSSEQDSPGFATNKTPTVPSSTNDETTTMIPLLPITEAVENCDIVNVILASSTHGSGTKQCMAIISQYENSHILKFMRMKQKRYGPGIHNNIVAPKSKIDENDEELRQMNMLYRDSDSVIHPNFELIATTHKPNGYIDFRIPSWDDETMVFWQILQTYLTHVSVVQKEILEIITTSMNVVHDNDADTTNNNRYYMDSTVIVMVCNYGQSELLMNFVCTARSRHIDLSNILVFTTDLETTNIVTALGLHCYYDQRNFGHIPKSAADQYGDPNFVAMMMAKVICVQLVSMLGYNILFQDVDIIWYRHPLQYFDTHQIDMNQYDIIFQDDGGRSTRFAPYSANTGFYYVRHNERTRHFLTSLLMSGDVISSTHSHQQVVIALLKEHVSLFGLKVKVLSRDTDEFPGGFHYHQRSKIYMKRLFAGTVKPYIFHMSWTLNKDNKILFLRQMGEWYVQEKCIQNSALIDGSSTENAIVAQCCSNEPIFSCHYRDKPSIKPCYTSPSIDRNRQSWW